MTDAIVIGAGVNGLAAAATLAMKGWKVAVFERADRPGGAAKTLELTLPGFRHDWGALNLSLFAGGGFHQAHGLALAEHWKIYVPTMILSVAVVFPALRRMGSSLSEHRFLPWAFLALSSASLLAFLLGWYSSLVPSSSAPFPSSRSPSWMAWLHCFCSLFFITEVPLWRTNLVMPALLASMPILCLCPDCK